MLGLGLASSHAPMMFQKAQYWPKVVERIPKIAREHLPKLRERAEIHDESDRLHETPASAAVEER